MSSISSSSGDIWVQSYEFHPQRWKKAWTNQSKPENLEDLLHGFHVSVNSHFLQTIPGETSVSYKVACGKPWATNGGKQPKHPGKPGWSAFVSTHKKQVASNYSMAKLRPCYKFSQIFSCITSTRQQKDLSTFNSNGGATCKVGLGLTKIGQVSVSTLHIANKHPSKGDFRDFVLLQKDSTSSRWLWQITSWVKDRNDCQWFP